MAALDERPPARARVVAEPCRQCQDLVPRPGPDLAGLMKRPRDGRRRPAGHLCELPAVHGGLKQGCVPSNLTATPSAPDLPLAGPVWQPNVPPEGDAKYFRKALHDLNLGRESWRRGGGRH